MISTIFKLSALYFPNGYTSCEGSDDKFTVTIGMLRNICEVIPQKQVKDARIFRREDPLYLNMEVTKPSEDTYSLNVLINIVRVCNDGKLGHVIIRRKNLYTGTFPELVSAVHHNIAASAAECAKQISHGTLFGQGVFPASYYNINSKV